MSELVGVATLMFVGFTSLVLVSRLQRSTPPTRSAELRFGRDLTPAGVTAVLTGLAGLSRSHRVVLNVVADVDGLRHYAHASQSGLRTLRGLLRGAMPDAQMIECNLSPSPVASVGAWARFSARRGHVLLATDAPQQAAAVLLGVLAEPLALGEQVVVRLELSPAGSRRLAHEPSPRSAAIGADPATWLRRQPGRLSPTDRRALEQKYGNRLLSTRLLVAVHAGNTARGRDLIGRVLAVFRARQGTLGRLGVRWLHGRRLTRALAGPGRGRRMLLSPAELTGLLAWPVDGPQIDGLHLGVAPRLAAPRTLPRSGRVLAHSDAGHSQRPLAQPIGGGLQHALVLGGTGSGKSTLIQRLVEQDLAAGRGALVIDAKGDLVSDLLARIPDQRRDDIIVIDPASGDRQPGLRLFPPGGDAELTADALIGTLSELFAESWGIRSSQYFRLGLVTLGRLPRPTLLDLPRLFAEPRFRAEALHGADPLLRAAWQRFEALSAVDQVTQLASPMTKFEELVGRSRVRIVLGQVHPRLHFGEVLARGRVVLVRLPPGSLGTATAQLLASVVMWQFFQAVEARVALPPDKRRPFMAYIDEVAWLSSLGLPLGDLLERARGLGVGLLLAPQALARFSPALRSSLLPNVGTVAAFRLSRAEAKTIADELPGITAEQLQYLERFHIALRLGLGPGDVSPVMTGTTPAPSTPTNDAAEVRAHAAQRWGASLAEVDAALSPPEPPQPPDASTDAAPDDLRPAGRVPRRRS